MRQQEGNFVVDFAVSDKFVPVYRLDDTVMGGKKLVGTFVEKKFKPERNSGFDMDELFNIRNLMHKVLTYVKM